ncbi:AfsR/SARP family transcriptional regulator [Streptomyces durbertensis]|uniref:AfsR/SARP family transcriptional regulator n=1 Tax=Streptomyces durbertensis TaxID=2448886 RepID=A0ABR6ECD8_9ACTN|nr:AfsR/SARP family transcriptional regulator [Streptomyces durbertensis]MBB1242655.1 AfsR/SARP family transcriptional regulator [Streptomyces durbertensis]
MRFEVLGPLSVVDYRHDQDTSLLPSASKKRVLLAALLSRVGEVVSTQSLITEIWADQPPRKARGALHVYMAQLRNQLAESASPEHRAQIVTEPPGYLLRLGGAEFDQHDFDILMKEARKDFDAGDLPAASKAVRAALGLWRGPALAGLTDGELLSVYATCLDEEYVAALELRIELDLLLGKHRAIISELTRLIHEYPLRETFYRHLMLAYYRSERQADALNCFLQLRERLRNDLGVEPCRPVQRLHQAVLSADPALDHQFTRPEYLARVPS